MKKKMFGKTKTKEDAYLYTIQCGNSTFVFTDYGAALVSWLINGTDIVLGYDTLAEYEDRGGSFGAAVGRFANRIAGGKFTLNGKEYILDKNNGENTLHGGFNHYNKRIWQARTSEEDNSITFTLFSPDGDQGFPGNLTLSVTYTAAENNQLIIDYLGSSDQDTLLNPTNHSYFNLNGHDSGNILDHELTIFAENYTPCKPDSVPDGRIVPVKDTPFDFTSPRKIGDLINEKDDQLLYGNGYDHNYVLDMKMHGLSKAASACSERSGIRLEVFTDLPGMQFYTGNGIKENTPGKNNAFYQPRDGFCLETQFFPNSINEAAFTSPILKAGERFCSRTVYQVTE